MATNMKTQAVIRRDRAFVSVSGAEAKDFLQGLLSQDVSKVRADRALYGALLTPQGKFLHDLFLTAFGDDGILLECEADRAADLTLRLKRYRLRAKIGLEEVSGWRAAVVWGDNPLGLEQEAGAAERQGACLAYVDPRLPALGARVIGPAPQVEALLVKTPRATLADYAKHRLALGVPEGAGDIVVEKGFLLESGFDELNGVDWKKGCYVGQELTARTKYRGLVKRRLMPVRIEGGAPESGAPLDLDGKNAGEMRGSADDLGLALVRLDVWRAAVEAGEALTAGDAKLWPQKPDWARF